MKRKFAGIAALGMALTLAFGMTVSAAPSPDSEVLDTAVDAAVVEKPNTVTYDEVKMSAVLGNTSVSVEATSVKTDKGEVKIDGSGKITVTKADGSVTEAKIEITKTVATKADVEKVNNVIQSQGALAKIRDTVKSSSAIKQAFAGALQQETTRIKTDVLTPFRLEVPDAVKEAIAAAAAVGAKVPVPVSSTEMEEGSYYIIMHIKDNGEVEYLGPAPCVGGSVTVGFDSLSPVVPIKVELLGDDEPYYYDSHWEGEPDYVPSTSTSTSGGKTSPQTGDVLPIAGFMAVICLAGAVVCVRKAHN